MHGAVVGQLVELGRFSSPAGRSTIHSAVAPETLSCIPDDLSVGASMMNGRISPVVRFSMMPCTCVSFKTRRLAITR